MNDTPLHNSISSQPTGYIKEDVTQSTVLHATSSLSFSVDQVIDLFGTLVAKLEPILTPDGGSPSDNADPMGGGNSHLFRELLTNERKLNYLCVHIQDVTRRIDL